MPHPVLAVRGVLSRGVLAVTVLVSLAVLFTPGDDVPPSPPGVDKLVHLALFAALALAARWAGARLGAVAVVLAAYALVSEVVQALAPLQRSGGVADWLADVLGVGLGVLAWEGMRRSSASR